MNNMPTAKQRLRLQALSTQLFGASSRWKKILDTSRIPVEGGYRSPSVEEVLNALEQNFEVQTLAGLPQTEMIETLVKGWVNKTLGVRLSLTVPADIMADFVGMVALVPEDRREEIMAMVSQTPVAGAFSLPGLDFVGEVIHLLKAGV